MNRGAIWSSSFSSQQQDNVIQLAVDTARRIADRPSTIVVSRDIQGVTTQLLPQTVRIEVLQNPRESNELRDALIAISKQYVVVIGYKDHPTIPNTDIQRADQFFYLKLMWTVAEYIPTLPGRLMVSAFATP